MVEAALDAAGWRVGRYSSPHVHRINERVSLQRVDIDDESLALALERAIDAHEGACRERTAAARACWFDVMTAAAFVSFREATLEWVVVEVGIGGRCDPTNVVDGEVAVITNVDLEHTDLLGPTREKIAFEKAGIIKAGATVVTTLPQSDPAGAEIWKQARDVSAAVSALEFGQDASMSATCRDLARCVLAALGARGVRSRRTGGFVGAVDLSNRLAEDVRLPGRMERFQAGPNAETPVVVDGAHVPFAVERVLNDLQHLSSEFGMPVVMLGTAADKDVSGIISRLEGRVDRLICVEPPGVRDCTPADHLVALARAAGMQAEGHLHLDEAWRNALSLARGRWILALGSLYLAGSVRERLRNQSATQC